MYLIDIFIVALIAAGVGWSICILSKCFRRVLSVYIKDMSNKKTGLKKEALILIINGILLTDLVWYGYGLRIHYLYGEEITLIRSMQIFISLLVFLLFYVDSKVYKDPLLDMDCVVQALSQVPIGIAFVNSNGVPVLINHKMYEINQILLGRYIPNLEITWDSWKSEGLKKFPVSGYKCGEFELFFEINKEVWRIRKEFLDIGFWQIRAEEITKLHEVQNEIRRTLTSLGEENKKYIRMIQRVVDVNSQEKYLNLKMSLHREFGDCMQAGLRYMNGDEGVNEAQILRMWRKLLVNITGGFSLSEKVDEKKELLELASLFHCKLNLPKKNFFGEIYEQIFYFCVREAMMNAIRHGAATKIYVTQERTENGILVRIRDNGKGLKEGFHVGGGLSGIREYLNQRGIPLYLKGEQGKLEISFLLGR